MKIYRQGDVLLKEIKELPKIKQTEKCKGAIAWTFGMKEEEYNLKIET